MLDERQRISIVDCPQELKNGLEYLTRSYPNVFSSKGSIKLSFSHLDGIPLTHQTRTVEFDDHLQVTVYYDRKIDAFRGLGSLMTQFEHSLDLNWDESSVFESCGLMIDCSRGSVKSLDTVFYFLRQASLYGFSTLQLYTEDTFKIPDEPMFGYLRGGYTQEDLKSIDDYAFDLGIEVFPCIQTLGHLGQVLQWPQYEDIKDTSEVLLVNCEQTYLFIEKLIHYISTPLRSKRIMLGMDEANGLGTGNYRKIHGHQDPLLIFTQHLQRVRDICINKQLKPMIWSDMLFTLNDSNYYDDTMVDDTMKIPKDMDLVYWDYYHTDPQLYSHKIDQHRQLGFDPWVAGACWTWNRFFCALEFTMEATKACLDACKQKQVRNFFITLWNDDASECDLLSCLPGLSFASDQIYLRKNRPQDQYKLRFSVLSGGCFEDWMLASQIDAIPFKQPRRDQFPANPSKWILWQDPILSHLSPQYLHHNIASHYLQLASKLFDTSQKKQYPLNQRLVFPALVAKTLGYKCAIKSKLVNAYQQQDIKMLRYLTKTDLQQLLEASVALWKYHRNQWLSENQPFGLEIIEMRYGALRTRCESLIDRIQSFCDQIESMDGQLSSLPELETQDITVYPGADMDLYMDFGRAYTPSRSLGSG
ncbi:glycoside hydrolase, family 20, catalytic core [Gorgonomyces haynaldii]|nr:glycoside hydrolase, family 20, catalytic core [Gorgonomyces haynaldii]